MTLPTLVTMVQMRNPDWVPTHIEGVVVNNDQYYIDKDVEVEVLTLNLNAGSMRVRFREPTTRNKTGWEVKTQDTSIDSFFEHYEIVKRCPNSN